jgi:Family of unknown function (DUF5675)
MKIVKILRNPSEDAGTFGSLVVDDFNCFTIELPWKDNENDKSCIPVGTYNVKWCMHPEHGMCYQVMEVPNRNSILIHAGNWAGDKDKGLRSDFLGCIGLGKEIEIISNQKGIVNSKITVSAFNDYMQQQDFTLEIINVD